MNQPELAAAGQADNWTPLRFSTGAFAERDRPAALHDIYAHTITKSEIEPLREEDAVDLDATLYPLPGLAIATGSTSGFRMRRTKALGDPDHLLFTVGLAGLGHASQDGSEVTVAEGEAYLNTGGVCECIAQPGMRFLSFRMSRSALPAADLDAVLVRRIPADTPALRMLVGYSGVLRDARSLDGPGLRRSLATHFCDLIALAIGATREAAETAKARGLHAARRAELYARANRLIALRFDDPDLAPEEMAHLLHVSSRHLQKIFAERGETVMTRLWDERLARAARLLSAPDAADRTVTDIAFACGFNDSSHFGRVFAERKGMTPSQWRKQPRAPSATEVESPPDRRAYN